MIHPSNATILIIDDDEPIRQTLADILELNGYRTITAANGMEGWEQAVAEKPAVVISDIAMPVMTGFELLEKFRLDPSLRTIPVIVISAKTDRAAVRRGMELGAADFITKPFTEDEVMHSVAMRLEKKELLDELDAFSHTVAHDLKNPLGSLYGRLELVEMMIDRGDPERLRRHLGEAVKSARRLGEIIDELLVLAGVRRQIVRPEPLDMKAIAAEAAERVEQLIKENNATVVMAEEWPASVGHPAWVMQIWVNYISNAAKYGGENPRIELGGELHAAGTRARFWVKDSGPGLDAEAAARLFVPFTRISSVRAKGHGLGLSIVRRIAEKLGGDAGVETAPGQGARFWFELPVTASGDTCLA